MNNFVELNNGKKMPIVGLGTFLATNESELENALDAALEAGYRHIDTAYVYLNEAVIGRVLNKWLSSEKITRNELFIVTKLPGIGMSPERVSHFMKLSLEALCLEYVDLYLIHTPIGYQYVNDTDIKPMKDGEVLLDHSTDLVAIWKSMEALVDEGLTKSIGVSNYNISQLERIIAASRIPPACLQVELHAYFQQKPVQEVCKKHNIALVAYSPLGAPGLKDLFDLMGLKYQGIEPLDDPVVTEIATNHSKTPAQILLRFLLQQGLACIPKSTNPTRLRQNIDVFNYNLSEDEMTKLKALDKGIEGKKFSAKALDGIRGHPFDAEHPEYPFDSY